jgi:hypothetical protein
MHFYYNSITRDVYYGMDYKAIFPKGISIEPTPKFTYDPLKLPF